MKGLTLTEILVKRGTFPYFRMSAPERALWLTKVISGGSAAIIKTITGSAPLTLTNAVHHAIRSLTQTGKCTQSTTPTPDAPVDIVCNNGALRFSANMANVNEQTAKVGWYISAQGQELESPYNWIYNAYIPVEPNTKYTLSMSAPVYYVTISEYVGEGSGFYRRNAGTTGGNTSLTITTGTNTHYIRFGANLISTDITLADVLAINWMLNEGDTAIPYAPYVVGGVYADGTPETLTITDEDSNTQTASVVNLFAVGDYKDEQEIISGLVNRKIGLYVFTGTEEFIAGNYGWITEAVQNQAAGSYAAICTHFAGTASSPQSSNNGVRVYRTTGGVGRIYFAVNATYTTKEAFQAFLAAQYAAGNPVIVVYPLAEPYTEQTTAHALRTTEGTNTVSVTSNVDPVTLEVKYKAKAEAA
ncbi:MAG: hypothetical protein IJT62_04250 [Oscillospiraceae bacterium]|nr:hypothetical protein [Oscillospiraceae bacterium]